jgi:hypothetical protein
MSRRWDKQTPDEEGWYGVLDPTVRFGPAIEEPE